MTPHIDYYTPELAANYDAPPMYKNIRRVINRTLERTFRSTGNKPYVTVFDVGAGTGKQLIKYAQLFPDLLMYTATEPSTAMRKKLMETAASTLGKGITCAIYDSPLECFTEDQTYDVVNCCSVFHHFDRPVSSLLKMMTFLNEGGRLVLETDNSRGIFYRMWKAIAPKKIEEWEEGGMQKVTYPLNGLLTVLRSNHFEIESVTGVNIFTSLLPLWIIGDEEAKEGPLFRFLARLDSVVERCPIFRASGIGFIIVARKPFNEDV